MKVCVLIPTWKRLLKLKVALRSLSNQAILPDRVIVVSRDIDEETSKWIKQNRGGFPFTFDHLLIDRPGVIAAENRGLVEINEDIVAFLDDDAEAPPDWIKVIKETLSNSDIEGVGGPDYIVHEIVSGYPEFKDTVGKVTFFGKVIGNHHQLTQGVHEVDVLKGVNMAFKRRDLPLLDENLASEHHLGNGSQWELDLCFNALKRGKLLFISDLRVNHYSNHSHFDMLGNQKNNAHNIVYVMLKHLPWYRKYIFLLYIFFVGNHQNVGLLKFLAMIPRHGLMRSWQLFISSCVGAFFGLKTYLGA